MPLSTTQNPYGPNGRMTNPTSSTPKPPVSPYGPNGAMTNGNAGANNAHKEAEKKIAAATNSSTQSAPSIYDTQGSVLDNMNNEKVKAMFPQVGNGYFADSFNSSTPYRDGVSDSELQRLAEGFLNNNAQALGGEMAGLNLDKANKLADKLNGSNVPYRFNINQQLPNMSFDIKTQATRK